VAKTLEHFREEVRQAGRDPAEVETNIQIMDTGNLDKLKHTATWVFSGLPSAGPWICGTSRRRSCP